MKMSVAQYLATNQKPSRAKWGNIHTSYNGQIYMSKKEANFAKSLDDCRKAKNKCERVRSYETQVKYKININGYHICDYLLDFKVTYEDDHIEYIDVKPFDKKKNKFLSTDTYKLKKKLVKALHNIDIIEK